MSMSMRELFSCTELKWIVMLQYSSQYLSVLLFVFQDLNWWRVIPMRQCRRIMTTSAWPLLQLASSPTFINFHLLSFEDACFLLKTWWLHWIFPGSMPKANKGPLCSLHTVTGVLLFMWTIAASKMRLPSSCWMATLFLCQNEFHDHILYKYTPKSQNTDYMWCKT